jgi:DivIVA domain-containing protein
VTLVFMIAAIAVIAAVAMLGVGRLGELPEVEGDRAPLALPEDRPLDVQDVDGVRFAVGLRGYRMDEVDDVLDRLADDIAARDARIAQLESQLWTGPAAHPAAADARLPDPPPASTVVDDTPSEVEAVMGRDEPSGTAPA